MANFPMSFPITWDLDNTTFIKHEDNYLAIHANGEIVIQGEVKKVAHGLAKYVFEKEYITGLHELQINKIISINFEGGIKIKYLGVEPPTYWKEFTQEFESISNRMNKMRVFW